MAPGRAAPRTGCRARSRQRRRWPVAWRRRTRSQFAGPAAAAVAGPAAAGVRGPAGGAWRSAVVGPAVLVLLVGGGDGAGDQGRGHVAVGEDPVMEAAEVEGVAKAGLGGGAEAFQLQAADQVAERLGGGHGV